MAKHARKGIVRKKTETGIYRKLTQTASTPEGVQSLLEEFGRQYQRRTDIHATLRDIEVQANKTLTLPASQRAKHVASDAQSALGEIKGLRFQIEKGDAEQAAVHALYLGMIVERWNIRPFEPLVVDAKRLRKARSKGAAVMKEKAGKRHLDWQAEINAHMKDPSVTYSVACRRVMNAHRIKSIRTVQLATVNPGSKRKR